MIIVVAGHYPSKASWGYNCRAWSLNHCRSVQHWLRSKVCHKSSVKLCLLLWIHIATAAPDFPLVVCSTGSTSLTTWSQHCVKNPEEDPDTTNPKKTTYFSKRSFTHTRQATRGCWATITQKRLIWIKIWLQCCGRNIQLLKLCPNWKKS